MLFRSDATLRARLMTMYEVLVDLIKSVQNTRDEVKSYKSHMNDWKKDEISISARIRGEQQANAKR